MEVREAYIEELLKSIDNMDTSEYEDEVGATRGGCRVCGTRKAGVSVGPRRSAPSTTWRSCHALFTFALTTTPCCAGRSMAVHPGVPGKS